MGELIEARTRMPSATRSGQLAPPPALERYPLVIGPGLSLAYISSIFRLSLVGYRQQYVDLLEELLEKELHGFAVLQKRILAVAGAEIRILPANESRRAQKIADAVQVWIEQIPDLSARLATLAWAIYYGIGGLENHWAKDGSEWVVEHLSFIHSRRLSFPVANCWDLYLWDQGSMAATGFDQWPQAPGVSGLKISDFPGKFIIHAPQIRGSYPTREGLGRQLAYWFTLKLIATRGAPQYLERFAKPWPEAVYRSSTDDAKRVASPEDIEQAQTALNAMGGGSLASWVHADTVALNLRTPDGDSGSGSKLTYDKWIEICNAEISKAVLCGTLTTEVQDAGGNRALGETQEHGELRVFKQDAAMLADTLRRDLISWMVKLNFPSAGPHLIPKIAFHVDGKPDPSVIIERAIKAAACNMPVDADAVADQAGIPLIKAEDSKPRRMVPLSPMAAERVNPDLAELVEELGPEVPAALDPSADPNAPPLPPGAKPKARPGVAKTKPQQNEEPDPTANEEQEP